MFKTDSPYSEKKTFANKVIKDTFNGFFKSNDNNLFSAAEYMLLDGGKRIRSIIFLEWLTHFGVNIEKYKQVLVAIESIHAYSLIHDDLPSIDNDDIRRGKPTCHIKYGEATALLAGDMLLNFAFEILSGNDFISDQKKIRIIRSISRASGGNGMIYGQFMDINQDISQNLSIDKVLEVQKYKTGMMFSAACESAGIIADLGENDLKFMAQYGVNFGIIFQIIDDIMDFEDGKDKSGILNVSTLHDSLTILHKLIDENQKIMNHFSVKERFFSHLEYINTFISN